MLSEPSRFLFTGIPGTGIRKSLEKQFIPYVATAFKLTPDTEPILCELEKELEVLAEPYVRKLDPETSEPKSIVSALRLPKPLLAELWKEAHARVRQQADQANSQGRDAFITFHACWFHLGTEEYITLANPQELIAHGARCLVTLIDDIYETRSRLRQDGRLLVDEFGAGASETERVHQAIRQLLEVLNWRMLEISFSEHIARSVTNGNHFLFPIKHPCETLFKLLYRPEIPRVYVSHPISEPRRLLARPQAARKQEGSHCMEEICKLSRKLRESFTLFEPTAIDELRFAKALVDGRETFLPILSERWQPPAEEGQLLWIRPSNYEDNQAFDFDLSPILKKYLRNPRKKTHKQVLLNVAEPTRIFWERLEAQVNARDHKLVEQSNGMAVFRPLYRGNRSSGVEEELKHLQNLVRVNRVSMKPVCVISCPTEDRDLYPSWELGKLLNGWTERGIIQPQEENLSRNIQTFRWATSDGEIQRTLGASGSPDLMPNFEKAIKQHGLRLVLPKEWKDAHGGPLGGAYAKLLRRWLDEEARPQLEEALQKPPYLDAIRAAHPEHFFLDTRSLSAEEYAVVVRGQFLKET